MKKIIKYILISICGFFLPITNTYAASFDISLTSNSVTVGNTTTLKITGTGITGKFSISSSNTNVATVSSGTVWIENNTSSITINTKNTGTSSITITPIDIADSNTGAALSLNKKSINITVNAKSTPKPNVPTPNTQTVTPKSSNSYLTSLTIDGLELNEKFDKETLEYTVTVPAETEKIKINAQVNDSRASVTGVGEVKVSEGLNTFKVVVTAENGSKRTYTLNATVEELKPINVTIDNEKYTIVRKRKDLPTISEYFEEKDVTIEDNKIEGYYNPVLKYILVGLKNEKGLITYYIYDNSKYTPYKEYTFNGTTLQILEDELSKGYKKTNFTYSGDKITSYQEVKIDLIKNTYALDNNDITGNQFYLFYAINVETGKKYLYQYDALEKTVQRYNLEVLEMYKNNSNTYYLYLLGGILLLGIITIIFSIILIKVGKKKPKKIYIKEENTIPLKNDKIPNKKIKSKKEEEDF